MNRSSGPWPLVRPLQRSTPESARKQPEGCGPHGFRFKGRMHGSEAKKASHEAAGRASLSSASRVRRVPRTWIGSPGRTRPTADRFKGRVHGSETKAASYEPFLRTVAFRPLQRWTPESARKQPEGCGPHSFRFNGYVHGAVAKAASREEVGKGGG
ncbi:MAG: hypothetical protein FJ398_24715 [Verrucomicrobia bacterium]|nr:hypothetical protein [Verrucomicrobiota bacterium]